MRTQDSAGLDLRDLIFQSIGDRTYVARISPRFGGVLSGVSLLQEKGEEIGVRFLSVLPEGASLDPGVAVAEFVGTPKQIALCEDNLIGLVSKYSGVASAAARAKAAAGGIHVVCGAWKKMPVESKQLLRRAVEVGGLRTRISDRSFVYLDKNYVRMFGGINPTLKAVAKLQNHVKAIQIRGETDEIEEEAMNAIAGGADILMIDTGLLDDVRRVALRLRQECIRDRVRLAFAGDLSIDQIAGLAGEGIDILDIGRAVIDAPLLDMRLDVVRQLENQARRE